MIELSNILSKINIEENESFNIEEFYNIISENGTINEESYNEKLLKIDELIEYMLDNNMSNEDIALKLNDISIETSGSFDYDVSNLDDISSDEPINEDSNKETPVEEAPAEDNPNDDVSDDIGDQNIINDDNDEDDNESHENEENDEPQEDKEFDENEENDEPQDDNESHENEENDEPQDDNESHKNDENEGHEEENNDIVNSPEPTIPSSGGGSNSGGGGGSSPSGGGTSQNSANTVPTNTTPNSQDTNNVEEETSSENIIIPEKDNFDTSQKGLLDGDVASSTDEIHIDMEQLEKTISLIDNINIAFVSLSDNIINFDLGACELNSASFLGDARISISNMFDGQGSSGLNEFNTTLKNIKEQLENVNYQSESNASDYLFTNGNISEKAFMSKLSDKALEYWNNTDPSVKETILSVAGSWSKDLPSATIDVILKAGSQINKGTQYSMDSSQPNIANPSYLDCSDYVSWAFHQAGIKLWGSNETADCYTGTFLAGPSETRPFSEITIDMLTPGDVGLNNTNTSGGGTNHIGLFIGTNENGENVWLHCSGGGPQVRIGNGGFSVFKEYINWDTSSTWLD